MTSKSNKFQVTSPASQLGFVFLGVVDFAEHVYQKFNSLNQTIEI